MWRFLVVFAVVCAVGLPSLVNAQCGGELEPTCEPSPTPTPTETPTPTITPTATPNTLKYISDGTIEGTQATAFRFEVTAGDFVIALLLFLLVVFEVVKLVKKAKDEHT